MRALQVVRFDVGFGIRRIGPLLPIAKAPARRRAEKLVGELAAAPVVSLYAATPADLEGERERLRRVDAAIADLEANLRPMPRRLRPACGARRPGGERCEEPAELDASGARVRNGRCRYHGGLSTGPRTAEGRQRSAEAVRRRHAEARIDSAMERERMHRLTNGKEDVTCCD